MTPSTALIESTFIDTRNTLLRQLKGRVGCEHVAEDLLQEVYLRVIEQGSVEEIANLPGYLYRTAINLVIDHGRRAISLAHDRHQPLEEGEDLVCPKPRPDQAAEASQELDILSRLIADLPPQCRRIFLLHKIQHLSHAEIAMQLSISPRTVETQIGKAIKILRDRMRTS